MKVKPLCASCLLNRCIEETRLVQLNAEGSFKVVEAFLKILAKEFNANAIPSKLGTERELLIQRISGNPDPYKQHKLNANKEALKLLPSLLKRIEFLPPKEALNEAVKIAIAGNSMEWGVLEHKFKLTDLPKSIRSIEIAVDDTPLLSKLIEKGNRKVLYLADNAGEIALDIPLLKALRDLGCKTTLVIKSAPIANDATWEDAEQTSANSYADKTVDAGKPTIGLFLDECSNSFLEVYKKSDVIIAKGMGHLESLTEYRLEKPHFFLLMAKCTPIAEFLGIKRGYGIIKMIKNK